ncbi:hypothetical protein M422DRAFT_239698 [Sphaerobolus stellatus SS14]|nr:hypothetical protein M422DRAFT_239698 [Sphaerobolus stellatus SS14]
MLKSSPSVPTLRSARNNQAAERLTDKRAIKLREADLIEEGTAEHVSKGTKCTKDVAEEGVEEEQTAKGPNPKKMKLDVKVTPKVDVGKAAAEAKAKREKEQKKSHPYVEDDDNSKASGSGQESNAGSSTTKAAQHVQSGQVLPMTQGTMMAGTSAQGGGTDPAGSQAAFNPSMLFAGVNFKQMLQAAVAEQYSIAT